MTCQDFPRKRGYARLFFVAALLAWLVPFLPLSFARAAMTGWAAGVEVPADFGEEIHTGEEATARVLSVRAAGPVEQGAGHVVTGTFQTWNADVRELWMEGLEFSALGGGPVHAQQHALVGSPLGGTGCAGSYPVSPAPSELAMRFGHHGS